MSFISSSFILIGFEFWLKNFTVSPIFSYLWASVCAYAYAHCSSVFLSHAVKNTRWKDMSNLINWLIQWYAVYITCGEKEISIKSDFDGFDKCESYSISHWITFIIGEYFVTHKFSNIRLKLNRIYMRTRMRSISCYQIRMRDCCYYYFIIYIENAHKLYGRWETNPMWLNCNQCTSTQIQNEIDKSANFLPSEQLIFYWKWQTISCKW